MPRIDDGSGLIPLAREIARVSVLRERYREVAAVGLPVDLQPAIEAISRALEEARAVAGDGDRAARQRSIGELGRFR